MNIKDGDLEKMYYNYISNIINYFKIKDETNFREVIAGLIKTQPDIKDIDKMTRWAADFTGTIFTFSTLTEDELKIKYKKELLQVGKLSEKAMEI